MGHGSRTPPGGDGRLPDPAVPVDALEAGREAVSFACLLYILHLYVDIQASVKKLRSAKDERNRPSNFPHRNAEAESGPPPIQPSRFWRNADIIV